MDYRFAYLVGTVCIGLPIWILLYYLRRDLRKELLFMTVFGLLITPPLVYWYIQDYWRPQTITGIPISIEDLLFGSLATGVSAIIYQVIFQKKYAGKSQQKRFWIIPIFVIANVLVYIFNNNAINSIYLTSIISALLAVLMILIRRDLLTISLLSGAFCSVIWLMCYLIFLPLYPQVFQKWWMLENLSGITIGPIPIEEFIWSMSWGMFAGVLYKFASGRAVK